MRLSFSQILFLGIIFILVFYRTKFSSSFVKTWTEFSSAVIKIISKQNKKK